MIYLSKLTEQEKELLKRKFNISQSAIKGLIDAGDNPIIMCPFQWAEKYVFKNKSFKSSEAMMRGNFFESLFIQNTAHNNGLTLDLKRKIPNKNQKLLGEKGDKTITQIRIEEQAKVGIELAAQKNIYFNKYNTQVSIYKEYKGHIIRGEMDMAFIPIKTKSIGDTISIIDLKLTSKIKEKFGPFAWGNFDFMNHLQAKLYTWLIQDIDFELNDYLNPNNNIRKALELCGMELLRKFNPELHKEFSQLEVLPDEVSEVVIDLSLKLIKDHKILFIYWVFDYSPEMNNSMFPYPMDEIRYQELFETLRKAISTISEMKVYYDKNKQFQTNHNPSLCNTCPLTNCPLKKESEFYIF
jgi:hypothetical protein